MCLAAVSNKKLYPQKELLDVSTLIWEISFVAVKKILAKWKITKTWNTKLNLQNHAGLGDTAINLIFNEPQIVLISLILRNLI